MKKARTLLAIWLALILTLTLFPTALADGGDEGANPDPNGGTATFQPQQVYVDLTNAKITDLTPGKQFNSNEDGATITFKIAEGYEWDSFQVFVTGTGHVADKCTLTVDETTGVYTLTIPVEVITNKVAVKLFTKEAAPAEPQDDGSDADKTPSTDIQGDGSGGDQTTPPSTQDGGANNDSDPTSPDNDPKNPEYELTYYLGDSFKSYQDKAPAKQTTTNGEVTVANFTGTVPCNIFWHWMTPEGQLIDNSRRVDPGQTITLTQTLTLTANWIHAVDITLNLNEGVMEGATTAQISLYKEGNSGDYNSYTLPTKEPTRSGYIFKGWEYNGRTYKAGDTFSFTDAQKSNRAITFIAKWSKGLTVNYSIGTSYNPGGGPKSGEVVDVYEPYTIPKEEPHRYSGSYEFGSWTLDINGKTYYPGNTINWNDVGVTKDTTKVTFTAKWTPMTYPDRGDDDDDRPSRPSYSRDEYRIRVTCSDGGWVSPAGSNYVREGRNLTVTFAPYNGYAIDGVYIDGVLDNSHDGVYTFRDVDENHTIYVRYVRESSGSTGGGHYWDDDTSPKTGDTSAPLGMGLGAGSLALIAFLIARRMRRA